MSSRRSAAKLLEPAEPVSSIVVTPPAAQSSSSLRGRAAQLYDEIYCARGEMENRIKEQQMGLFADRTSCHAWWPNQMRLLISALAYTLMETIRRVGLAGSELAKAQVTTIRLKLLKIGAIVIRNTRRIKVHLSSACPHQALFRNVATILMAPG